ncbi:hypothetical protein HMPREF3213_04026 [Heyndrickxia coagulans]|jgi:hypothetical protein|uniref:Uncharacterized protein n=1 Tax=Heyndrickxia coagulans TaxID=1398 RepID=A0A133K9Q3_HEYCO|nr:hypothetical protein HMPREF3213_04026 [Heyndrickxia coagulans]
MTGASAYRPVLLFFSCKKEAENVLPGKFQHPNLSTLPGKIPERLHSGRLFFKIKID